MSETLSQKSEEIPSELEDESEQAIDRLLAEIAELRAEASEPDAVLKPFGPVLRLVTGETVLRAPIGDIADYVHERLSDQIAGRLPTPSKGLRQSIQRVLEEARDALKEASQT